MFKVYWTNGSGEHCGKEVGTLNGVLTLTQDLRSDPTNSFVTMVSENPNCVGKPGVDSVINGLLPDGTDYTWKKRR